LRITIAVLAAVLLAPAVASAQTYPEPKEPGKVAPKPPRPYETHTVCKKGRCDFRSIQKAVNAADAGDTIKVRRGVYKEAVRIDGRKKRYLKLIGNPKKPGRVVLEGSGKKQNGIAVNEADEVTVSGFKARNYRANGFFFTNLNGYTMNHLVAVKTGVYGLYAFNTIGGRILNSEAYYVNDGAFYIGQTPPQDKPVRTMVKNVEGWGSPIGFSATNMRYVTITKSRFYNNAVGIVPNALDSEKFPPPEQNAIVDNEIFWNNLNFHEGTPPFTPPPASANGNLVPIGTGILLLGGRDHLIEDNKIYGNFLAGVAAIDGILLQKNPLAVSLDRNVVRGNEFGLGGTDVNGRDIAYDGSGSDNCFTLGASDTTHPSDRSTVGFCATGKNLFSQAARDQMIGWTGTNALSGWVKHDHPAKKGYKPLEDFKP
jgi:Pectinesterase